MASSSDQWPCMTKERCEQLADKNMDKDITVRFLLTKMREAGCEAARDLFVVRECSEPVGGGFDVEQGKIVLCHNHLGSLDEVACVMKHELIHAYDQCTAKGLNWADVDDRACSEIRAAALSGDCSRGMELLRGNWRLRGQYQTCIKRRAALSIVDACPGGQEEAEAVVGRNFETCFQDTRPFATHPNQ